MQWTTQEIQWMALALRQAERGLYTTSPNPHVGCVIVKDGKLIGEGAHLKAGEPHAEVHALRQAGTDVKGATAYVTLEPCSHYGRTPPCAHALVEAGIRRVYVAMQDPNPLVAGQGIAYLQDHGIEVHAGLLEAQAQALNPGFVLRMAQQRPYVRLKVAASLDGKTALANGVSQWITSPASRRDVHHWRARSCAMLTGIGTILHDNPSLTVRDVDTSRQPVRVIVDSQLRIPLNAKVLEQGHAIIAFAQAPEDKIARLQALGVQTLALPDAAGQVDIAGLLQQLAQQQLNEILVEAGAGLNGALLQTGLVDELLLYYAPKLMGTTGTGMFTLPAFTEMSQSMDLDLKDVRQFGQDIRIQATLRSSH
ncbi:MAG TPA: bifunctional diaminohydroxyphosphoribosylaminopyrimidine deaminase/5-amino-6-(5-phosphoribosylamino)uracil reductase RibD [Methylophilus sp.]|uniref:bifunctional diaminohydroxyphosphoribosylaminopyrimidine deaminase/5-amino-6-(5-phosphoribosylamino)uracil reductase RibD n=1 Tax=Methylophilus sp. TaxID=29541 RepID=UPI002B53075A|nr:bifunctional diaminohydroxyphosphoribosylaminopyrimidine deaminase/5-amino-6-(5-phosphoribosylamino)uracil reductase RibD [Methylophilus sp.]HSH86204.1 bifunctional diaminohydroxyphosphoribosylaminopyrimidine deaminase/5-amino-6-(5-phosphoribosylamino)uracil reductase RibD [Methylophilus sp.]